MIKIQTKNNLPEEIYVKNLLNTILQKYDCPIFTEKVIIDKNAISHSHPVLTIGTKWFMTGKKTNYSEINSEFPFLSVLETFIHEQFHWFVAEHSQWDQCFGFLRKKYRDLGDCAKDNKISFWIHLIVLWNVRNYLNKILDKSQINLIYNNWRPYPLTEKFVEENFTQLHDDLDRHDMIYK